MNSEIFDIKTLPKSCFSGLELSRILAIMEEDIIMFGKDSIIIDKDYFRAFSVGNSFAKENKSNYSEN
jgi:hypothetical protein